MPQTATANLTDFEPNTSPATASLDEFQPEVLPAAGPVSLNTKRGGSSGLLPPEPSKPSWRDYAGAAWSTLTGAAPGAETGLSDTTSQEASQGLKETEIRIGGQFKGGKPRQVRIPRSGAAPAQPAIEAPTIEPSRAGKAYGPEVSCRSSRQSQRTK